MQRIITLLANEALGTTSINTAAEPEHEPNLEHCSMSVHSLEEPGVMPL